MSNSEKYFLLRCFSLKFLGNSCSVTLIVCVQGYASSERVFTLLMQNEVLHVTRVFFSESKQRGCHEERTFVQEIRISV